MQINSIGNLNFGLQFNESMYEVFNEGRQTVAERNSRSLKHWATVKKTIKNELYDDTFMLHAKKSDKGHITIFLKDLKEEKSIEQDPGIPVMTLKKLAEKTNRLKETKETLDMPYIINLKNLLTDLIKKCNNNRILNGNTIN